MAIDENDTRATYDRVSNAQAAAASKAAHLGANHAFHNRSAMGDPVNWLDEHNYELPVLADENGVDLSDRLQWDAYCAAFYLAFLPSDLRLSVSVAVRQEAEKYSSR